MRDNHRAIPIVAPSCPSELSWILDLLVQRASYAGPALEELDQALLPGIATLRASVRERFDDLWSDDLTGCPELVVIAHHAGSLLDGDTRRLFDWLRAREVVAAPAYELLSETETRRPAIQARIRRLCAEPTLRTSYAALLCEVWRRADRVWRERGSAAVAQACAKWRERLGTGTPLADLVAPRHPLTRAEELGLDDLMARDANLVVSPLYFCLSGGHVVDVDEYVHVAVASSDLLPIRKRRDAAFVADRLRVLAEPTRVHILIQLMSAPAGVMDLARTLGVSQPTVSAHVSVLLQAGLIQPRRLGSRSVFMASRKRIERLLEDARATLARWD